MLGNGVMSYKKGTGIVANYFPVDSKGNEFVCCTYCNYYSKNYNNCKLTGEIIVMADKYVGAKCPLKIEEE